MSFGRHRAGAALMEAIVALAVLATAGVAMLLMTRQSAATFEHVATTERNLAKASQFLVAVSLWPASVLDQRLGDRRQGDWRLLIEKREGIYRIALTDTATSRVLLSTSLYRRALRSGDAP